MNKILASVLYFTATLAMASEVVISDRDGTQVTTDDIEFMLKSAPVTAQKSLLEKRKKFDEKVTNIYLARVLAQEAKQRGLGESGDEKRELERILNKFYAALLFKQVVNENTPDFEPLAKKEYQMHPEKYKSKARVSVSHLLIKTDCKKDDEALALITTLKEKLTNGDNFEELVKQYSEAAKAKENLGLVPIFVEKDKQTLFERVAFQLKHKGQISDVVKSVDGYHLIKLNKRFPSEQLEFEQVKDAIIYDIVDKYAKSKRQVLIDEIMEKNDMKVDSGKLDAFVSEKLKSITAPKK